MLLSEAITNRIIFPDTLNDSSIWRCRTCGQYLTWYLGKYHFTCKCNEKLLEEKNESNL